MHDDLHVVDDVLTVFGDQLLTGGSTMEARRHQNTDAGIGSRAAQTPQQDGHDDGRRHRAGVVGTDDDNVLFVLGQFLQPGGADGVVQGFLHQFGLTLVGTIGSLTGNQNTGQILLLNVERLGTGVIGQADLFHGTYTSFVCLL